MGGVSIKIGDGPSCAQHRTASTQAFLAWLEDSARQVSERVTH
jgi:hypothetical protein